MMSTQFEFASLVSTVVVTHCIVVFPNQERLWPNDNFTGKNWRADDRFQRKRDHKILQQKTRVSMEVTVTSQ